MENDVCVLFLGINVSGKVRFSLLDRSFNFFLGPTSFEHISLHLPGKFDFVRNIDIDFEIEKQFVNPDKNRLEQLATNTNGKVYYPNQIENLIQSLLDNENYIPTQKEIIKKSPLIDWVWLLVLAITALATEWFTRKYNGLL